MRKAAAIILMLTALLVITPVVSAQLLGQSLFSEKEYCVDTDSFKTSPEFVRGYAQDSTGYYWDECTDDSVLVERICSAGFATSKEVECEKGCFRGACIKYSFLRLPTFKLPFKEKWESLRVEPIRLSLGGGREEAEASAEFRLAVMEARVNALQAALKSIYPNLQLEYAATDGIEEIVFPLVLKVTATEGNMDSGAINDVFYVRLDLKGKEVLLEMVSYENPDVELMADKVTFRKLKALAETPDLNVNAAETLIAKALGSNKAKINAYTSRGELAKKLETIRLKSYS